MSTTSQSRHRAVLRGILLTALLLVPSAVAAWSVTPLAQEELQVPSENVALYGEGWHLDADGNGIDDRLDEALSQDSAESVILHIHYATRPSARDLALVETVAGAPARLFSNWDDIEVFAPVASVPALRVLSGVLSIERVEPSQALMNVARAATRAAPANGTPIVAGFDHSLAVSSAFGLRGQGMVIAIIDTGVNTLHESLDDLDDNPATSDPKLVQRPFNGRTLYAAVDTSAVAKRECTAPNVDLDGHGSHVAGTALGTGGGGANVGVAPAAKLVDVKIAAAQATVATTMIAGLDWILNFNNGNSCYGPPGDDKIDVASLSFSTSTDPRSSVSRKLTDVARSGITVVVATGNDGPGYRTLGGSAEGVILVANSDDRNTVVRSDDVIAPSSSRGPRATSDLDADVLDELRPDIAAPGTNIVAPLHASTSLYWGMTGTSMSAPHIAGIAALILQANPTLQPLSLSNEQMGDVGAVPVRDIMQRTAETRTIPGDTYQQVGKFGKTWSSGWGYGLVDAYAAVEFALQLTGGAPDLTVDRVILPSSAEPGDAVPVGVSIRNLGIATAGNSTVRVLVDGVLHHEAAVPAVAGGAGVTLTMASFTAAPGRHTISVFADVYDAVIEANEANNFHQSDLGVREVLYMTGAPQTGGVEFSAKSFSIAHDYGSVTVRVECKFTTAAAGFLGKGDESQTAWTCAQNQRAVVPEVFLSAGSHTLWLATQSTAPVSVVVTGVRAS